MMDFKNFLKCMGLNSCVISVQTFSDGSYGNIRIVDKKDVDPDLKISKPFVPDSPYENFIPKNLNFEEACYQAAILHKSVHTYTYLGTFQGGWYNMFFLPLESNKKDTGYCIYAMEYSKEVEADSLSSVSQQNAAEVLKTCIKLKGSQNIKDTMNSIIKDIRDMCKAEYCCILLMDKDNSSCSILCEDRIQDTRLSPSNQWMNEDFFKIASSWKAFLNGNNCLIIKNSSDMEFIKEKNPDWYKSLYSAKVESLILFPLVSHEEIIGYIWTANFSATNCQSIKQTLELTTFFLASEIANHLYFLQLQKLSSIDMLTGVFNRNEMNNKVDKLRNTSPEDVTTLGVVFADVNGLKKVNDNLGHAAGDTLLQNAAALLKEIFFNDEIFRAGGDEFMILTNSKSPEELEKKLGKLRESEKTNENVSIASGASFINDSRDIISALKIADQLMYEDKKRHYQEENKNKLL